MNKTDLIKTIARDAELSNQSASKALDTVIESIIQGLIQEGNVSLAGLGTFSIKERAERQGRNPRTGEPITIKAAKLPTFKAGKALKDAIQEV